MDDHDCELKIMHLEGFRFIVASKSRRTGHLVDLEENDGHGQCGCENYGFSCYPKFKAGVRGERATCIHLRAVQRVFSRCVVMNEVAKRNEKVKTR